MALETRIAPVGDGALRDRGLLADRAYIAGQWCHADSRHVADALDRGAELLLGGHPHEFGGTFFSPTVLDGVSLEAHMSREETFGPVAGIHPFSDEDQAITIANDTP